MKPTIKSHIIETEELLGQHLFLYDENSGDVHELNGGAAITWFLCDGTRDEKMIAEEIADACNISEQQVLSQVQSTVAQFHELGLLEQEAKS